MERSLQVEMIPVQDDYGNELFNLLSVGATLKGVFMNNRAVQTFCMDL